MIPKVIHFIWFSLGNPTPPETFLGIKSAVLNTTCKIVLHTDDPTIQITGVENRPIALPELVNGKPFLNEEKIKGYKGNGKRIANLTEITRLDILYEEGGIYSDIDVLWFRNPVEYLDSDKAIIGWGNEGYKIAINCLMMAPPNHPAIKVYRDWNESIYPPKNYWGMANPYKIWKERDDVLFVKSYKFNIKKWNKTATINWADVEKSVCVHLHASMGEVPAGEVVDYLKKATQD